MADSSPQSEKIKEFLAEMERRREAAEPLAPASTPTQIQHYRTRHTGGGMAGFLKNRGWVKNDEEASLVLWGVVLAMVVLTIGIWVFVGGDGPTVSSKQSEQIQQLMETPQQ